MKSETILMKMPFIYSLLFISFLATSCCAQSSESEATGERARIVSSTENPSSEEVIDEKVHPVDIDEVLIGSETVDNGVSEPKNNSSTETPTVSKENMTSVIKTTSNTALETNNVEKAEVEQIKEEVVPLSDPSTLNIVEEPVEKTKIDTKSAKKLLSHDAFDELLRAHVSSIGAVDYSSLARSKSKLNDYLSMLKNNPPESSWSKNKEIAYWINMYNAFTISSVLEKYPINSIMDLEGGKVWDKKKIIVGGKSLTLNIIEKEKLLKRFKEPRVHFAVNCGAFSCPPLMNKAWTEDNVQRYLSKRAKDFINDSQYNTLSEKSIDVSQIFNWYAGDFGGSEKVLAFIQKYSDTEINTTAKVKFKEYDWKLNQK
jgi:hypothetical protein